MFIGRRQELAQLQKLTKKGTASLVCLMGRRRIGKSTLISEFGKTFPRFVSIQGLGPDERVTLQDQLDHFSEKISDIFNTKKQYFDSWTEALSTLAKQTSMGPCLILLDEISWMSKGDPLFPLRVKDVWDTQFKKNNDLILVLCGSVSAWIEDNILKNASFEGRISLELALEELRLPEIRELLAQRKFQMGMFEVLQILAVTGGVPKYLEEILPKQTAEQNLIRLCYDKNGILFNDFDKIFVDIFGRKSKSLEKIVRICLEKKLTPNQLALELKSDQNSDLTEAIHILELSGFLSRDFYFQPSGKTSKLSHLRIKDNYLRFYLKFIEPKKKPILKGGKVITSFMDLKGWTSIMGLQFENIVLQNKDLILKNLAIENSQLISAAPYVQRKKSTNKGTCQIDLLIHTNLDVFYLCEIKCRKEIDSSVIEEVKRKTSVLQLPRRSSLKTVFIYEGEMSNKTLDLITEYFYQVIPFEKLFLS
jgi:AAA+ ATPase superfamily predicted ATPase